VLRPHAGVLDEPPAEMTVAETGARGEGPRVDGAVRRCERLCRAVHGVQLTGARQPRGQVTVERARHLLGPGRRFDALQNTGDARPNHVRAGCA
jgi:hypothetical protein